MKKLFLSTLILIGIMTSAQAGDYSVDSITKTWDSKSVGTGYKINLNIQPGHGYRYLMCRSYPFVGGSNDLIIQGESGWKELTIRVPYGSPRQTSVSCQFQRPVS